MFDATQEFEDVKGDAGMLYAQLEYTLTEGIVEIAGRIKVFDTRESELKEAAGGRMQKGRRRRE